MTIQQLIQYAHLLTTVYMAGLIWFVQIVHYPLFANVGEHQFTAYERLHQQRTTWVVAPPMLIELVTALLLFTLDLSGAQLTLAIVGAALIAVNWLSTMLLQVPLHRCLASGFDTNAARRLVRTNWIRTIAWTIRAVLAVAIVV